MFGISRQAAPCIKRKQQTTDIWFVDNCCDGALDLTITPSSSGQLELEVSKYGEVNLRTIESSLSNAIEQVNRSGEDYPDIPRLVVLALASDVFITSKSEVVVFDGLAFQKEELWKLIDRVMKRHPELSAVAVMARQANPHFDVFHNSKVSKVPALDVTVFEDGRAVQFDSLETIPRVRIQPFDLQKQFEALLAAATEVNEIPSITLSDYDALWKKNR